MLCLFPSFATEMLLAGSLLGLGVKQSPSQSQQAGHEGVGVSANDGSNPKNSCQGKQSVRDEDKNLGVAVHGIPFPNILDVLLPEPW